MAEDLTEYLQQIGIRVRWLHSEIHSLDRIEILRDLRLGVFDVLVGVNLLREGLDLPEVSLVAIMEADKEGFLRAERSLIQTIGRAARNADGRVILYGDRTTDSMAKALKETNRRRSIQLAYNQEHNITPQTIIKDTTNALLDQLRGKEVQVAGAISKDTLSRQLEFFEADLPKLARKLEQEMKTASRAMEYERAAELRDQLMSVQQELEKRRQKTKK